MPAIEWTMLLISYLKIGMNCLYLYKKDFIISLKTKKRKTSTPTITSFRYFFRNWVSLSIKYKNGLHYKGISFLSFMIPLLRHGADFFAVGIIKSAYWDEWAYRLCVCILVVCNPTISPKITLLLKQHPVFYNSTRYFYNSKV